MAELTRTLDRLDRYLDYLEHRFAELEENQRTWDTQSSEDKGDFLLEWPIVEDKFQRMQELIERNGVPDDRRERYDALMERISRDRPILDSLWERSQQSHLIQ